MRFPTPILLPRPTMASSPLLPVATELLLLHGVSVRIRSGPPKAYAAFLPPPKMVSSPFLSVATELLLAIVEVIDDTASLHSFALLRLHP
ncbi:hypothetical protein B0H14DRAFT_2904725 [Mycena olivaceomarginata]|nr:hypothetical protein B0H14DRAFT_2904725 [Mycena olivaceomarginata]